LVRHSFGRSAHQQCALAAALIAAKEFELLAEITLVLSGQSWKMRAVQIFRFAVTFSERLAMTGLARRYRLVRQTLNRKPAAEFEIGARRVPGRFGGLPLERGIVRGKRRD